MDNKQVGSLLRREGIVILGNQHLETSDSPAFITNNNQLKSKNYGRKQNFRSPSGCA